MKNHLSLVLFAACVSLFAANLNGQPAAGGAARGRGTPMPPPTDSVAPRPAAMNGLLTAAQQQALDAAALAINDQNTVATNARQALIAASLVLPRNDTEIGAKAAALGEAEQALALARADAFAKVQAGPSRVPADGRVAAAARINAGGRGGRGGLTPPRSAEDNEGFTAIFDGRTLTGWDGDPSFWRVENGMIVGESTPQNPVAVNNFLIWRGETVEDFELKVEFRINGENSGIQYRSQEMPEIGKWILRGYQADLDVPNQYTGNVHEERGRNVISPRGQFTRATGNGVYKFLATIGDPAQIVDSVLPNGWNTYHIIARGPMLVHIFNGRVSSMLIDEDAANRATKGVIGFQMHTGGPFKVQYRNIFYRKL